MHANRIQYEDTYFDDDRKLVKFELFGNEIIDKHVRACGKNGRIYLPPDWVGCKVKIVKLD